MQAFIAPADFNPDAQELNIVNKYAAYLAVNANARYIFSVAAAVSTTTLPTGTGISCRIGETISATETQYDSTASSVTWTAGSIKRWVIVNSTSASMAVVLPNHEGAVWCYLGNFIITSISATGSYVSQSLKYIHCFDIHKIMAIGSLTLTYLQGIMIIPSSCISVGDCSGNVITGVIIEDGVQSFGAYAFYSKPSLIFNASAHDLIFPESVRSLGGASFAAIGNLTGICYLGANVNNIGGGAIASPFTTINVSSSNPYYASSGGIVYNKAKTVMITIAMGFTGEIVIENTCTSIRDWDNIGGAKITKLTIPASLVTFGNQAFNSCTGLTRIDSLRATPAGTNPPFPASIKTTCVVHVPIGSLDAYRANAYWNGFTNIIADL